jgi:hypothetical protein
MVRQGGGTAAVNTDPTTHYGDKSTILTHLSCTHHGM